MRISEEHSSVAEPVGMVRDALNIPPSSISSSSFKVRSTSNGRYFLCSLEVAKADGSVEKHDSSEALFPAKQKKSAAKTHFRVGAVSNADASKFLGGTGHVYRSAEHAKFAAAVVAIQRNDPSWFERKHLTDSSRSICVLFPSSAKFDLSYRYNTRAWTKTKHRHDPIAFILRRGDSVVWLDAAAMQQKDLLETGLARDGKIFDHAAKRWADLMTEEYSPDHKRYVPMTNQQRMAMEDCWSGKDNDLVTASTVSSSTSFQLSQTTAVVARKVMVPMEEYPFVPVGWVIATTERRQGKSKGGLDHYFYSPRGYRFRSRPEVERFVRCQKSSGNEVLAKKAYDQGRCMEHPTPKKASSAKKSRSR